ncbi:MAG: VCBS repeat-containing protein [Planctomycetota bacterium]
MLYPVNGGPPYFANNSFSGSESNRLFFNDGNTFTDVSGLSGADHRGDGRGFAVLDYDRDGWQDMVLFSTNYPRIKLLKNMMGDRLPNRSRVLVSIEGANQTSGASSEKSSVDSIGCVVVATYESGRKQAKRLSAGEGNAAQNSSLIWFGQTNDDRVIRLNAKWTSGKWVAHELIASLELAEPIQLVEPSE